MSDVSTMPESATPCFQLGSGNGAFAYTLFEAVVDSYKVRQFYEFIKAARRINAV
jgi:hypothetical protein